MQTITRYKYPYEGVVNSPCEPETLYYPNWSGTTLTVGFAIQAGLHQVIVNGLEMMPNDDYTFNGNTFTFAEAITNLNVIIHKECDGGTGTGSNQMLNMGKFPNNAAAITGTAANPALNQYLYRATLENDYNVPENSILFIER